MTLALGKPLMESLDFSQNPFIVIWEMTRSCALKCLHCRAEAVDCRDPNELTTEQARQMLGRIRYFGNTLVVLTGGDPMRRSDAIELVEYGSRLGLRMAMTPSATPEMSFAKVLQLKESGLARLAVSLDGSNGYLHDYFRGVAGSFDWTIKIIEWANQVQLPVQINTTITKHNLNDLENLCRMMESLKIVLWSVFFLVPVGRGRLEDEIKAADYEKVFHRLALLQEKASFDIKSTEAPHFRRVLIQKKNQSAVENENGWFRAGSFVWSNSDFSQEIGRASKGVNDGNGFMFISHHGDIYPSGFLPVRAGNVKTDSISDIYRNSDVFKELRDPLLLKGKCGVCEFHHVCGGSRSRAYAVCGDYLASDPFCVYVPKEYKIKKEEMVYW